MIDFDIRKLRLPNGRTLEQQMKYEAKRFLKILQEEIDEWYSSYSPKMYSRSYGMRDSIYAEDIVDVDSSGTQLTIKIKYTDAAIHSSLWGDDEIDTLLLMNKGYQVKIGRTGQDMIEAATEFKRAGKDIETSLEMGEAALVMTNVADGIDQTSDAASTLISVLNGFNMDDSDAMSVVDKLNSVSNQSPVGFDNLADGLERVSGTMNQAGNSLDETIGMLTGGFTQLRNMEKVSSGLITISQRLRAVDEDGEAIDGLSAELESAFGSIGVAIEDANGDLRSTYDILHDYAQVFPTLTSEQKQYFGELAAGKRQVNVFNAIVDEMATVDTAINQSVDSLGAAEKENETYRQSIQGLKNEFENQFQMLSKEVIDSDWIKNLISAGTDFLEVLTNIVKQEDIMSGTISVVTDLIKGLANILKDISGNDFVGSLIKGFLTFKTVTKGIDIFNFFKGKSTSKNAMDAFFQSAMNGTLKLEEGIIKVGEAEKKAFSGKSGFGKLLCFKPCFEIAAPSKVA